MASFAQGGMDLDIETLIKPNAGVGCRSNILDFIHPRFQEYDSLTDDADLSADSIDCFVPDFCENKATSRKTGEVATGETVVVTGDDICTQYTVTDLRRHELPVIGTFIHPSVLPGFRYRVRLLGKDRYQFGGEALVVQRVGLGYGKRITFESPLKNVNNNYFYSDTQPRGFGFSLVVVKPGDAFTVLDGEDTPVGSGVMEAVAQTQTEVTSRVDEEGAVVKQVAVWFTCGVRYGARHGVFPLVHETTMDASGLATVVKTRGEGRASTRHVTQVELPLLGPCTLQMDEQ